MSRPRKNEKAPKIHSIPLSEIIPPSDAVRSSMDPNQMQELIDSIRAIGLINALTVKKKEDKFEIVAGHRRYIALERIGWFYIPVTVCDQGTTAESIKLQENSVREPIGCVDEAVHLDKLLKMNPNWSHKELAKLANKSEGYISQRLAILKFSPLLIQALKNNEIVFSVARELAKIKDDSQLEYFLNAAISNGASPAIARAWVASFEAQANTPDSPPQEDELLRAMPQAIITQYMCHACHEAFTDPNYLTTLVVCRGCKTSIIDVVNATRTVDK